MNLNPFLTTICASLLFMVTPLQAAPEILSKQYDLRVYGPITAAEQAPLEKYGSYRHIRMTAEDHAKAEIVLSKILSDFTTLPTVVSQDVVGGETTIPALCFKGGRRILPVLRSHQKIVDVYLFDTPEQLDHFLASAGPELAGAISVKERKHPYFLDFWDRHAMGFWFAPMIKEKGFNFTDESDFEFLKKYGLNVNGVHGYYPIAARSHRDGVGYKMNRWFDVSNYVYDAHPEDTFASDPDMTRQSDYYGDVPFAENRIERGQIAEMMAFYKQFTGDPNLVSLTDPHGETGPGWDMYNGFRDRGEPDRQDFIHYLRDLRKISLSELGQRWYGQPGHFKTWQDVVFPREREFYGWKDGISQDTAGIWKMRRIDRQAGEAAKMYQPDYNDSRWFTFKQPGAQYLTEGRAGGWLRCSLTPAKELLNTGKPIYLTVCPFNIAPYTDPSIVYLNGQKLAELSFGAGLEWGQFDVTALLKPGVNLLSIYTRSGAVYGPSFLTLKKAESFPTSDPDLNSRLYDLREWTADVAARANSRYIEYMRGVDPVRPIKLMAFDSMIGTMMPNVERLGAYPHCTGEGAFFRPWFKRYGYLRGVPDSSEPSQPAKTVAELKYFFFTMTFEGMNAHDYFIHLHSILADPAQKAWYEQNVPYYELMGRFDLKKPDIAIARSTKVDQIVIPWANSPGDSGYQNDLGRGEIQQAHHGYVFCSERDIKDRLLDGYKVIIDDNFHTLESQDVENLEGWVKWGGTLVLNQRSGRNTYLQPNTWPISNLTGCTATIRPQEGTVKFENAPPILKAYAGQSFANKGESIDWQKFNYYTDSIALEPKSKDVQVVARYNDGKPAIVIRAFGKGRVVVLGSAFYRKAADIKGYWQGSPEQTAFYEHLLADLGVAPLIESDQDKLWAERFIANNGSTEMLILGNQSRTDSLKEASATWDLGFAPSRVFDPVTGADLPVKINGTKVSISGLNLPPHEMRYYAVERTDWDGAQTIKHWLFRQSQLWHSVAPGRPTPPIDPSWPIRLLGDYRVKQFDSESDARQALLVNYSPDKTWSSQLESDWSSAGLRTGKDVWGVYRKIFTIDKAWLNDLRGVQLMWQDNQFSGLNEIAINGLTVLKNDVVINNDKLFAALKPGPNLFTLISRGRNDDGNGGFIGDLAIRRIPGASGKKLDISSGWTAYASDIDSAPVDFPAQGKWLMVRKSLSIPENANKCSVWIEVEGKSAISPIVVSTNGRLRYMSNSYGAPFNPKPLLVNITPDVVFGKNNEVVLGRRIADGRFYPDDTDIQSVRLILVPKL